MFIAGLLDLSGGFRSLESRSMAALNVQIYLLSFLKVIWIVLCANWMFRFLGNHFWFWCFSSIILSAIATVKEVKTEMCLKPSIGIRHPIYEIATSDVWSFKRLETRVFKNQMFFWSRKWGHSVIYSGSQAVEWLQ